MVIEWLKTVIEPGTYYVRVEAMEDGLTGYYLPFGLALAPPAAPAGVSVETTTRTGDALTWDGVADASRYKVEYRQAGVQSGTEARDAVSGTTHAVSGLTCGTGYAFRVSAYGDGTAHKAAWGEASTELIHSTAACNVAPAFGSSTYAFSVAEDAAVNAAVGTVTATDADNYALAYSITAGDGGGKFAVGGSAGAITVAAGLDYEITPSYSLTVQADDGNGGTATATVTINDQRQKEGPASPAGLSRVTPARRAVAPAQATTRAGKRVTPIGVNQDWNTG